MIVSRPRHSEEARAFFFMVVSCSESVGAVPGIRGENTMVIACPICTRETTWEGNPHRPFCSERCRMIDLGAWVDGEYRVPVKEEEWIAGDETVPNGQR